MTSATQADLSRYRLPDDVVPSRYDLTLRPDIPNARFSGEETVTIDVRRPTRTVTLNAKELQIQSAQATREGQPPLSAEVTLDEELERATLSFPSELAAGEWKLNIAFTGILNDKLKGFYRSTYKDENGVEQAIATTQFESTDARRAFPCWDEPAFKAVFAVTLVIDKDHAAISNGSVKRETVDAAAGTKTVVFNDTPVMSTYLVAFVVGAFEASDPVDVDGIPLRVWCAPGKKALTPFALKAGAHALAFFIRYYGIPYPGAKLDMLAIPDFASGAMENLGAITYREALLLLDEGKATYNELERVATVEAHEIAHMWFGDLVTMQWWNGLWLKEAFATFMEMLAVDDFRPDWEIWTSFAISRAGAMLIDGLRSTRPIEYPVVSPDDAQGMYDVLTYEKGAAVLRMLQQYLGPENFRRGINNYLNKHKWANAETTDLWDALEESTEEPVRAIADSWIFQPGYPLVSVEERGGQIVLSQQRFVYEREGEPLSQQWQAPVALRIEAPGGAREEKVLLKDGEASLALPGDYRAIVANAGGNGVYRVRYSPALLAKLTADVQGTLSAVERFNLVNDSWANVQAGYTPLSEYLDLTGLFKSEPDRNVWSIVLSSFAGVRRILPDAALPDFERFVRNRLEQAYATLGWEPRPGESDLTRQWRGQILGAVGTLGNDQAAIDKARELHRRFVEDPASVDPEVAAACVSIVANAGDATVYDEFFERFRTAKTPQDERRYMYALAAFRPRPLIERTLEHLLDGSIRTQDAPFVLYSLLLNSDGGALAWNWLEAHWEEILRRFPDNSIIRIVEGVPALSTPELARQVEAFLATHSVPAAGKRLDQSLERLRIAVAFRQREAAGLPAYLARQ
ncbi:MAG TPA: M1 family metallopeptidase [Dehalococcoidia bacterium]|nr:M1 family metallopeptidase [Dehalococcoidia bacterium]